jgi:hypothetical protein
MKEKRMVSSILLMIAVSAVFVLSSAFTNATAQTSKTTSSTDSKNYKDFQNCLSSAEDGKGYATKKEIKDCYNPIYNPTATIPAPSTTASSNVFPRGQ